MIPPRPTEIQNDSCFMTSTIVNIEKNNSSSSIVSGCDPSCFDLPSVQVGAGIADKVLPPLLATADLQENYFVLPYDDDGKA